MAKRRKLREYQQEPFEEDYNELVKDEYADANRRRMYRIHAPRNLRPGQERLGFIVDEINTRMGIGKKEIYLVGELLVEAKEIVGHGNFQEWIGHTFDFSYETAVNFMNVFKVCLGNPAIVETMKASVLYQIAAPGFPADLREHIFETGRPLENFSSRDLRELLEKYKAGELDEESDGVKKYFEKNQRWTQLTHVHGILLACIRDLRGYRDGVTTVGRTVQYCYSSSPQPNRQYGQDREAGEKIVEVIDVLLSCATALETLKEEIEEMVKTPVVRVLRVFPETVRPLS